MTQRLTYTKIFNTFNIFNILVFILVGVIYFEIHRHFWFLDVIGVDYSLTKSFRGEFIVALFCLGLICKLIHFIKNERMSCPVNKTHILPLIYVLSGIIVLVLYEKEYILFKRYFLDLGFPIIILFSIFIFFDDNKKIKQLLLVIFIAGIIFSIYSVVGHVFGEKRDIVVSTCPLNDDASIIIKRFAFAGIQPNIFASMLILPILAGVYFTKDTKGILRYFYIGMSLFMIYVLILTLSRGGFVSLSIGILYLFWRGWFKFNKKTAFVLLIAAIIIYVQKYFLLRFLGSMVPFFPWLSKLSLLDGVRQWGGWGSAWGGEARITFMLDSLSYIADKPIFGYGFSNFIASQTATFTGNATHNYYLKLFASAGIVTFIPFVLTIFFIYSGATKILKERLYIDQSSKDMGTILIAGLLSYVIDLNFAPANFLFYWILFGMAMAWSRNCKNEYYKINSHNNSI